MVEQTKPSENTQMTGESENSSKSVSEQWKEYQGSPTGSDIECKGWQQEAALRLLNNNLDPEVAEDAENLVVYGGNGKAARSWDAYDAIMEELRELDDDETLLVQSGKPVGKFRTKEDAPAVLLVTATLVGKYSTWDEFRRLESEGKMMYGNLTAGSWAYIGTQGILQSTYQTFAEVADHHFDSNLRGRIVITGGLGGMGGAQPLAVTMNEGVCIAAEVSQSRIDRRIEDGFCEEAVESVDEALERALEAAQAGDSYSVAVQTNVVELLEKLLERDTVPDIVTDQTAAHDEVNGYYPLGYSVQEADSLREEDPDQYREASLSTMKRHVSAILELQQQGSICFEYGNNLRGQVADYFDYEDPFDYPGFVDGYIRSEFCRGYGPFRCIALSGDKGDIQALDELALDLFSEEKIRRWIEEVQQMDLFQGLPARTLWLGFGEKEKDLSQRARMAVGINDLVADGEISAPIVITREHEDGGSAAVPNRETENMKDGTDTVADWVFLNALLHSASGADIVSINGGGGTGIGTSIHASQHVVLDGSKEAEEKAKRIFTNDPGTAVMRYADAGYEDAVDEVENTNVHVPMEEEQ